MENQERARRIEDLLGDGDGGKEAVARLLADVRHYVAEQEFDYSGCEYAAALIYAGEEG